MGIGWCRASIGNNRERQYLLERNSLQIIREKTIRINKADAGFLNTASALLILQRFWKFDFYWFIRICHSRYRSENRRLPFVDKTILVRLRTLCFSDIILSLTVVRRKNHCIPCVYWGSAIFAIVLKYSNCKYFFYYSTVKLPSWKLARKSTQIFFIFTSLQTFFNRVLYNSDEVIFMR